MKDILLDDAVKFDGTGIVNHKGAKQPTQTFYTVWRAFLTTFNAVFLTHPTTQYMKIYAFEKHLIFQF